MTSPVIQPDSSDARKTANGSISATRPSRPSRVFSARTVPAPPSKLAAVVGDRLSDAFGAFPVRGIVHGHTRPCGSQGGCNPSADAFGGARHDCDFLRQSTHSSAFFLIRLPVPRTSIAVNCV